MILYVVIAMSTVIITAAYCMLVKESIKYVKRIRE